MRSIGSHGLSCLEPSDYAAFALYMQCQAEAIDDALTEQLASLDSLLDRPTIIVGASGNVTTASGVNTNNFYNTVVYNNSTFMGLATTGTETYVTIGSPVTLPLNPYQRGMYLVGAYAAMDATGAVTAFSQRNLTISALDDTLSGPSQVGLCYDINPDANTALTNIRLNASFSVVLRGTNGVRIAHQLSHTNAASTVTYAAADAKLWVTYLGPTNLVEVP